MSGRYLGYDPGGGGAHGVAMIADRQAICDTVPTAQDAITWFGERCRDQAPSAVGIDTLTLWSTGPAGWRPADRALRAAYPEVAASIVPPNSLYGAMPINGVAVGAGASQDLPYVEDHRDSSQDPVLCAYAVRVRLRRASRADGSGSSRLGGCRALRSGFRACPGRACLGVCSAPMGHR